MAEPVSVMTTLRLGVSGARAKFFFFYGVIMGLTMG